MNKYTPFNPINKHKVHNPLPPITWCHYCGSDVSIEENKEVYGRNFGDYPWIYLCDSPACGAYVGIHPNTNIPLGTLANAETREARRRVKNIFLQWCGNKRDKAYPLLAQAMGIPSSECHFGWFDLEMCKAAERALLTLRGRVLR